MEFTTHPNHSGFLNGISVEWLGDRVPGTTLVWKAMAIGVKDRLGLVIAVRPESIDVCWADWVKEDVKAMPHARLMWYVCRREERCAASKKYRLDKKRTKWEAKQENRVKHECASSPVTST